MRAILMNLNESLSGPLLLGLPVDERSLKSRLLKCILQ